MVVQSMLIPTLIVLNIPVYLFIGWLVFDTSATAAESFYEAIVSILKAIFIPGIIRVLMDEDDESGVGLLAIAAFLFACGGIVYGEHYLITEYFN
jgi:hypothetical protein